jgi:hypothetical protein
VIGIFAFVQPWRAKDMPWVGTSATLWAVTGYVLFPECGVLFNLFGTEGNAAAVLFLFPSRRRQMLVGKGLVILGALFVANIAVVAILCVVAGSADAFGPLLAWMEIAIIVIASVGNLVSVLAPFRAVRRGWRVQPHAPGRGCAYGLTYLIFYLIALALALPALAAALLPAYWLPPVWFALTIPLAVGYAVGGYLLSLLLVEPLLLKREFEMIRALTREEG